MSPDDHKKSLVFLLQHVGSDFAHALRTSLLGSKYSIYEVHAVIGRGWLECQLVDQNWGYLIVDSASDEDLEAMTIGMLWLMSLEPCVTLDAESITVEWIDEWLENVKQ